MKHATTSNTADDTTGLLPPKRPKASQADFADARRACRTPVEREQLALVLRARWTSAELQEYARLYYFKNGRDYPTPSSYRRAKPHFNVEFPGHTPAFLKEVTALAQKDRRLSQDAPVSPRQWKITCNKHYVLVVAR